MACTGSIYLGVYDIHYILGVCDKLWKYILIIRGNTLVLLIRLCGAVAERLRRRSREQKVPSSIPRLGISVEVTSSC